MPHPSCVFVIILSFARTLGPTHANTHTCTRACSVPCWLQLLQGTTSGSRSALGVVLAWGHPNVSKVLSQPSFALSLFFLQLSQSSLLAHYLLPVHLQSQGEQARAVALPLVSMIARSTLKVRCIEPHCICSTCSTFGTCRTCIGSPSSDSSRRLCCTLQAVASSCAAVCVPAQAWSYT